MFSRRLRKRDDTNTYPLTSARHRYNIATWTASTAMTVLVLALLPRNSVVSFLKRVYAEATGAVLSFSGISANVQGGVVFTPYMSLEVISSCTALVPTAILLAAVLVYPAAFSAKLKGVMMGIVSLAVINLARLVSLVYLGKYAPAYLETAHLLVWQSLIVFSVIAIWLFWAMRFANPARA